MIDVKNIRVIALPLLIISLACAVYFPFRVPPTRAHPQTVEMLSYYECGENQLCYHLRVVCEDLEPREAEIRVNHLNDSRGVAIFVGGGYGRGYYGGAGESAETVKTMLLEGFETYEVRWLGDNGWGTNNSGRGFKALTCGFAELGRWIIADLAKNATVVGATGHSGGANQIAYGLAVHGLDEILDVAVLTGGPARTDLVALCLVNSTGVSRLVDYVMGWEENGEYCQRCEFLDWVERDLQSESIVSSLEGEVRNYNYTRTKVCFVNGEFDIYAENGRLFYDTIVCEKEWVEIAGVGHGVPGHPEGAARIREILLDGLTNADIPEFLPGGLVHTVLIASLILLNHYVFQSWFPWKLRCLYEYNRHPCRSDRCHIQGSSGVSSRV